MVGVSDLGLTSTQQAAATFAASTASGAATAAATVAAGGTVTGTAAVTSLLTAAGASAAVPFAGWIAAGAMVSAAAILQLVVLLRKRGVKKQEAIEIARGIGFSDAAAIPGFTLRALEWSSAKRARKAATLQKRIGRKGRRGKGWRAWRSVLKLQLLGVVEALVQVDKQQVQAAGRQGGPQAAAQVAVNQKRADIAARAKYDQGTALVVVGVISVAAFVAVSAYRRDA